MSDDKKKEQIDKLLTLVQKDFKKAFKDSETEFIDGKDELDPTGLLLDCPLLEKLLSSRFLIYGRCYLIYGNKADGKTSFFYDMAKRFQKAGGLVFWLETENAASKVYAFQQGLNIDEVKLSHPQTLEEALTSIEGIILNLPKAFPEGETPVLICLDSIAGTMTEYESDQNIIGETKPGNHAKLLSEFYRKITNPLSHEKCIVLTINQLREQIGSFGGFGEEKPEAMIGGRAPRFHSTYQLKFARTGDILEVDPEHDKVKIKVGSSHKITCKRNKLGIEGNNQFIQVDSRVQGGYTWFESCVEDLGKNYEKLMTKAGGYYRWNIPNTKFLNPNSQQEEVINIEQSYLVRDMATIIANSEQAKELIREAYHVPPLPSYEEVVKVENENKKKRKKKVSEPKTL